MIRYPPAPYDWEESMRLLEDRFDDHLTDEEVRARLEWLDRVAVCAGRRRRRDAVISSALGVIGIVVMVCGIGALLFGVFG